MLQPLVVYIRARGRLNVLLVLLVLAVIISCLENILNILGMAHSTLFRRTHTGQVVDMKNRTGFGEDNEGILDGYVDVLPNNSEYSFVGTLLYTKVVDMLSMGLVYMKLVVVLPTWDCVSCIVMAMVVEVEFANTAVLNVVHMVAARMDRECSGMSQADIPSHREDELFAGGGEVVAGVVGAREGLLSVVQLLI